MGESSNLEVMYIYLSEREKGPGIILMMVLKGKSKG
jgi:hypothetical protein